MNPVLAPVKLSRLIRGDNRKSAVLPRKLTLYDALNNRHPGFVQVGSRLVEQQYLRISQKREGVFQALSHARGVSADKVAPSAF